MEEKLRGQGIGRLLMNRARKCAKEYQADSIELNVWAYNQAAQGFYAAEGFADWQRRLWLELGERETQARE